MENLKKEIEQLKQEKNAVLLAHYYVDDAVQEIADYVGDSYYLAKVALKESKDVICFAGVNFMECQDLKPRPYSDHARSEGRLPNGSYGRCRED